MDNQFSDTNSVYYTDLGHKKWEKLKSSRVEPNPSATIPQEGLKDITKELNVVIKNPFDIFFVNYEFSLGNLTYYDKLHHERLCSVKQIVLVNLGEFNLFQFPQSYLLPANTFVVGFIEYNTLNGSERKSFYEQFTLYTALKAAHSVEIFVPRRGRLAFYEDVYAYLNAVFDPMIKIIVLTTSPGKLQGELALNGRNVTIISPLTMDNRTTFI